MFQDFQDFSMFHWPFVAKKEQIQDFPCSEEVNYTVSGDHVEFVSHKSEVRLITSDGEKDQPYSFVAHDIS